MGLPESIKIYAPLDAIRHHLDKYMGANPAPVHAVLLSICDDIGLSGARSFEVFHDDAYVVVTSATDWMVSDRASFNELFERMVMGDNGRPNPNFLRGEIFVAALSAAYFTDGPAGQVSANMTYDDIPSEYRERIAGKTRYLIFDIRSPYFQPVAPPQPEL